MKITLALFFAAAMAQEPKPQPKIKAIETTTRHSLGTEWTSGKPLSIGSKSSGIGEKENWVCKPNGVGTECTCTDSPVQKCTFQTVYIGDALIKAVVEAKGKGK